MPPQHNFLFSLWEKWQQFSLPFKIAVVSAAMLVAAIPGFYLWVQHGTSTGQDVATPQGGQSSSSESPVKSPASTKNTPSTPNTSNTTQQPPTSAAKNGGATQTTPGGTGSSQSPSTSATNTNGTTPSGNNTSSTPAFPDATNTGVPAGVTLHSCATTISSTGTYDSCQFDGGLSINANDVHITRSLINGQVNAGDGTGGSQTGLVLSDSTINCNCQSQDDIHTPWAVAYSNFSLLRVNVYNSGHGAAVSSNVTIQDSYIHGLGGNTNAHKDGIYVGDGTNVTIRHNNIECNDGPLAGCTSAIGLLSDFSDITYYTIDNNLLNTNGSYCFYGGGGPKPYSANHITFTNNHFGRKDFSTCGALGPVTYWDSSKPGMVWSGNVWDDTGETVLPVY